MKKKRVCTSLERTPVQFTALISDDLQPTNYTFNSRGSNILVSTHEHNASIQTYVIKKNKNKNNILKQIDRKMLK